MKITKPYENKEWLYNQYVILKKTPTSIASEIKCSYSSVIKNLKLNGIEIRKYTQKGRVITWGNKISEKKKEMYANGKLKPTFIGKKHTEESRKKISLSKVGRKFPRLSEVKKGKISGDKNPNFGNRGKDAFGYKGDRCVTPLHSSLRKSEKYIEWRKSVFLRDEYICKDCGVSHGSKEAHHIKSFSSILKENKIDSFEKAMECNELWDIDNGKTLCRECHKKTFIYFGNQYDKENRVNSGNTEKRQS